MAVKKLTRKQIGKAIMNLRISRQMTQSRLSEISHIKQATISRIESGELIPSALVADDICTALGITVDDLLLRARREEE